MWKCQTLPDSLADLTGFAVVADSKNFAAVVFVHHLLISTPTQLQDQVHKRSVQLLHLDWAARPLLPAPLLLVGQQCPPAVLHQSRNRIGQIWIMHELYRRVRWYDAYWHLRRDMLVQLFQQ